MDGRQPSDGASEQDHAETPGDCYLRAMRDPLRRHTVVVVCALALFVAACGAAERGSAPLREAAPLSPPETDGSATQAPEPSPTSGRDAGIFAFVATTVAGERFDASQLAGRDVAIWFWAPW